MIVLYKSKISDLIFVLAWLRCRVLCKICFVCVTGMLEYLFVVSKEAKVKVRVFCGPGLIFSSVNPLCILELSRLTRV